MTKSTLRAYRSQLRMLWHASLFVSVPHMLRLHAIVMRCRYILLGGLVGPRQGRTVLPGGLSMVGKQHRRNDQHSPRDSRVGFSAPVRTSMDMDTQPARRVHLRYLGSVQSGLDYSCRILAAYRR